MGIPEKYRGKYVGVICRDTLTYRFTAYLPEDAHNAKKNLRGFKVLLTINNINEDFCRRGEVFVRGLNMTCDKNDLGKIIKLSKGDLKLEDVVREICNMITIPRLP